MAESEKLSSDLNHNCYNCESLFNWCYQTQEKYLQRTGFFNNLLFSNELLLEMLVCQLKFHPHSLLHRQAPDYIWVRRGRSGITSTINWRQNLIGLIFNVIEHALPLLDQLKPDSVQILTFLSNLHSLFSSLNFSSWVNLKALRLSELKIENSGLLKCIWKIEPFQKYLTL